MGCFLLVDRKMLNMMNTLIFHNAHTQFKEKNVGIWRMKSQERLSDDLHVSGKEKSLHSVG